MNEKGQENMELIIGVVFVLVLGAALFAALSKSNLPGADKDPEVKVKDDSINPLDLRSGSNIIAPEDSAITEPKEQQTPSAGEPTSAVSSYSSPPSMNLKDGVDYVAILTTSEGTIEIDLLEGATPITVNNFIFLARAGFYNGTRSHRVIKDFMVQFGDPLTKDPALKSSWGTGDPGYKFADEPFEGSYERGTVAMANSGPNTNGSQFFIMHKETPLPKSYVIFGKVTKESSLNVLDIIADVPVTRSVSGEQSLPTKDIVVQRIEVREL